MRDDWVELPYKDVVDKISTTKQKLKQKEYLAKGKIAVVDQGQEIIGGYTNDESKILECELPVLVFGDHTKIIKTITFPFAPGADGTKVLQPKKIIEPKLLSNFTKILVHKISDKGYARHYQHIEKQNIKIPPLPEQRAIVAKIDQLFTRIDHGVADLEKAQAQLKIYRQAVLKKAFEGELTRKWREKQTNLPMAEELLSQIKKERENHHQVQLDEWKKKVALWEASGREGKKPGKPKKLKTFNQPVKSLNLIIPENWYFECIGNLSKGVEYGSSAKSLSEGRVIVLRMGNMQDGKIDWENLKYSNNEEEILQYKLEPGDILFNRTNSPELVGKTVEYKGERKAIFAGYLIRLNHLNSIIKSSFLNWFLNSHPAKVYGSYVKTDGVNQSNINGQKLGNYPIPICSIQEQHQIVQEIETRLSVCDKLEQTIKQSLEKAKALRQSILKKAFEGRLLDETELAACKKEKDYEPARVLLKKIQAKKAAKEILAKAKIKPKKKTTSKKIRKKQ
ncbi:MAG: restriction endonuclease [Desulfobacteraceae bacterium]|nr:restriction endonuclease [Desulfobacteraceae bacterium]